MPGAKLKVGLVIDTDLDAPDGVQQYVLTLSGWLQDKGHQVRYLSGGTKRADLPGLYNLAHNIRVHFNGNSLTIPLPARKSLIQQVLAAEQFDVLHVQTPHSPFLAQKVMLAADPQTAIIGTFHILPYGWMSSLGNRMLGIWLRPSLKRFDEVVSVSQAAADFAQASFGIKTSVVPNMINISQFIHAKPLKKYADQTLTILFLGRLVPRKGSLLLLEAVVKLREQSDLPAFRVVICGSGQLEPKLRRFITENNLNEVVELAGFVSEADKPRYYASADIAVFPSQGGESFGIVLLEAMAAGHAVVLGADNPGYHSVLGPQADLLFTPGNVEALAAKLAYYLINTRPRQQMAVWEKDYVRGFDINVVGQQLLARYYQALRKRRSA